MMEYPIFKMIACLFFFIYVIAVVILLFKKKKEIWSSILGENGQLELPELIGLVWLILFPVLVLSELFFKMSVSTVVWASMDVILASVLVGKAYNRKHNNENNDKDI